jgi:predicted transcriptional regulator
MRYPKTEWGIKLKVFSQRYGLTLTDIAKAAGVNVNSLYQVQIGKTPGHKIVEKVNSFIEKREAEGRPALVLTPFEEAKIV